MESSRFFLCSDWYIAKKIMNLLRAYLIIYSVCPPQGQWWATHKKVHKSVKLGLFSDTLKTLTFVSSL